jgi:hypothetical protein
MLGPIRQGGPAMAIFDRTVRSSAVALLAAGLACFACAAAAAAGDALDNPPRGGSSSAVDPAPARDSPRQKRAVYVCHDAGVPVFADRPCGAASAARVLTVEAGIEAGAPATTAPRPPKASTRPLPKQGRTADAGDRDSGQRCVALRRQLDDLDDRMRAGYSAREAARLWQRWRDARERLRTARC